MDNLYKTPEAPLLDGSTPSRGAFFVTSTRKMAILYIATLGLYTLYWGYKQWDSQRLSMQPKHIMPVWRSIFIVFFMHSLSRRICERLHKQGMVGESGSGAATLFVFLVVVSSVLSSVTSRSDLPAILDVLAMVLQLASLLPMLNIQRLANLASDDPDGASNDSLSGSNIGFIIVGGLFWLLYLLGLAMLLSGTA
ncbi:hypothetical protein A9179_14850 [Pseudomonas alcaligenes]|uniref:DUF4234 domain-containing protein n=1 Tax=Aquipseudomonas alcaligenes TaxID=43263 RepID=A0ABR7S572_AQUAC|nr:MFS transporter permease [Pseudomonas alcaligenes]MBC9251548.1 hypothetical protein [Pseudomonas alcaligenes]